MTGQEIQDRLDALVADLQTKGKGQTVNIMFRNADGSANVLPLSSDANGVVSAAQLAAIDVAINNMQNLAADYNQYYAPVQNASDTFKLASDPHQVLSDAASLARKNYNDAIAVDPVFQAAKTALDNARSNADFIAARDAYISENISENYSELSSAKGKYVGV